MFDSLHRAAQPNVLLTAATVAMSVCLCCCIAACQATESKPASRSSGAAGAVRDTAERSVNTDPTAVHLHDLAGQLLMFHFKHGRLPLKLRELESSEVDRSRFEVSLKDPATGSMYAYSPESQPHAGLNGRVIVYQSVPTNPAGRWALLASQGPDPDRLILYVARVPEPLLGAATRP